MTILIASRAAASFRRVIRVQTTEHEYQGVFSVGKLRFDPDLDVYNVFNSNVVLSRNQNFR